MTLPPLVVQAFLSLSFSTPQELSQVLEPARHQTLLHQKREPPLRSLMRWMKNSHCDRREPQHCCTKRESPSMAEHAGGGCPQGRDALGVKARLAEALLDKITVRRPAFCPKDPDRERRPAGDMRSLMAWASLAQQPWGPR
ncbi:hypothetical protein Q8A67_022825 [Cirrhinus molitorella]|uniref:Uncharacterized protein n=1 Tax=Cirrhinus molitorella TaxID=172907 RepID=A0AA88TDT1_9TELE|nr:hypothetical protein Q8A67_022825 [Cirrhinus molitorella]